VQRREGAVKVVCRLRAEANHASGQLTIHAVQSVSVMLQHKLVCPAECRCSRVCGQVHLVPPPRLPPCQLDEAPLALPLRLCLPHPPSKRSGRRQGETSNSSDQSTCTTAATAYRPPPGGRLRVTGRVHSLTLWVVSRWFVPATTACMPRCRWRRNGLRDVLG